MKSDLDAIEHVLEQVQALAQQIHHRLVKQSSSSRWSRPGYSRPQRPQHQTRRFESQPQYRDQPDRREITASQILSSSLSRRGLKVRRSSPSSFWLESVALSVYCLGQPASRQAVQALSAQARQQGARTLLLLTFGSHGFRTQRLTLAPITSTSAPLLSSGGEATGLEPLEPDLAGLEPVASSPAISDPTTPASVLPKPTALGEPEVLPDPWDSSPEPLPVTLSPIPIAAVDVDPAVEPAPVARSASRVRPNYTGAPSGGSRSSSQRSKPTNWIKRLCQRIFKRRAKR
ncbi:hypothetical protein [Leptolyngbya sp. FACHB-261]|uniref:hypothetical protein n=1 Tax=Leptolyngbya sp. FACHB-261 TaxID=2692806 RepID=UPI001682E751|nr:hypothetical protein [Leptolyngbya sp. FACHB-261]MBD2101142.1 hypothetical protein [Leptolyngbya sp. FACHB-261]